MLHARSMVVPAVVGMLAVAVSGCSGSGASGQHATSAPKPSAVAGRASCTLHSGHGKVQLRETADAYDVTWTGLPLDDSDEHDYTVQLGNAKQTEHTSLVMAWSGTTVRNYGVVHGDSNDVDEIDGDPQVNGGTIHGTFPKQAGLDASWWAPQYKVIPTDGTSDDVTTSWCTADGQVSDYTPLG